MNLHQKTEIFISLVGVVSLFVGIQKIIKRIKLTRKGIKAEGVVLRIEKRFRGPDLTNFQYYPVVKYLTVENNWITQEYDIATPVNIYNEGDKITLYYDSVENSKFIIDTWLTKWTGPLFIFIGLSSLAIAIRMYVVI